MYRTQVHGVAVGEVNDFVGNLGQIKGLLATDRGGNARINGNPRRLVSCLKCNELITRHVSKFFDHSLFKSFINGKILQLDVGVLLNPPP